MALNYDVRVIYVEQAYIMALNYDVRVIYVEYAYVIVLNYDVRVIQWRYKSSTSRLRRVAREIPYDYNSTSFPLNTFPQIEHTYVIRLECPDCEYDICVLCLYVIIFQQPIQLAFNARCQMLPSLCLNLDAVGWAVPTIFSTTSRARLVNSFLIHPHRIE